MGTLSAQHHSVGSARKLLSSPALRGITNRVLQICPAKPTETLDNFFSSTICHLAEIPSEIRNIGHELVIRIKLPVYRKDVIPVERVREVIQSLPVDVREDEGSDVNAACVLDVDIVLRRVELELLLPLELVPECL